MSLIESIRIESIDPNGLVKKSDSEQYENVFESCDARLIKSSSVSMLNQNDDGILTIVQNIKPIKQIVYGEYLLINELLDLHENCDNRSNMMNISKM